jgi:hypothetical protein
MTVSSDIRVTNGILLEGALIFALIDLIFVAVLAKIITPEDLVRLKWKLAGVMAVFFFFLFGFIMSILFWDSVYSYVFPPWTKWIIPPAYGLLFASAGLLFWSVAVRMKRIPVIVFCLLGGLWGIITHVIAILRGILDKPPMLKGSDPFAALTIAFFEFIFYWCVCLAIAKIIMLTCSGKKNDRFIDGSLNGNTLKVENQ